MGQNLDLRRCDNSTSHSKTSCSLRKPRIRQSCAFHRSWEVQAAQIQVACTLVLMPWNTRALLGIYGRLVTGGDKDASITRINMSHKPAKANAVCMLRMSGTRTQCTLPFLCSAIFTAPGAGLDAPREDAIEAMAGNRTRCTPYGSSKNVATPVGSGGDLTSESNA
jgi:hypothetical protein